MTTEALEALGDTMNFIDIWLKLLEENDEIRYGMYNKTMKYMFKQITTRMYKQLSTKQKNPETYNINWWCMVCGKSAKGIPPLRRSKMSEKHKIRRTKSKNYMKLISGRMFVNSNYIVTSLNGH